MKILFCPLLRSRIAAPAWLLGCIWFLGIEASPQSEGTAARPIIAAAPAAPSPGIASPESGKVASPEPENIGRDADVDSDVIATGDANATGDTNSASDLVHEILAIRRKQQNDLFAGTVFAEIKLSESGDPQETQKWMEAEFERALRQVIEQQPKSAPEFPSNPHLSSAIPAAQGATCETTYRRWVGRQLSPSGPDEKLAASLLRTIRLLDRRADVMDAVSDFDAADHLRGLSGELRKELRLLHPSGTRPIRSAQRSSKEDALAK